MHAMIYFFQNHLKMLKRTLAFLNMNMGKIFLQLNVWTNWFHSGTFYDPIESHPAFFYLNTPTYHISEVKCIANVVSHGLQTQRGDLLEARNVDLFQFDWLVNRCEIVPHTVWDVFLPACEKLESYEIRSRWSSSSTRGSWSFKRNRFL